MTPIKAREQKIKELRAVIDEWKLGEILDFVSERNNRFKIDDNSIATILERFLYKKVPLSSFPDGKREIEIGDMSERTKKVLDIILIILNKHKIKMSLKTLELFKAFLEEFKLVINEFDEQQKSDYFQKIFQNIELTKDYIQKRNKIIKQLHVSTGGKL